MVKRSVRFDAAKAITRADELGLSRDQWSRRANVSKPTLDLFRRDANQVKLTTIEAILRPLRMCAADILVVPLRPRSASADAPADPEPNPLTTV
jgi:hypothetical protein